VHLLLLEPLLRATTGRSNPSAAPQHDERTAFCCTVRKMLCHLFSSYSGSGSGLVSGSPPIAPASGTTHRAEFARKHVPPLELAALQVKQLVAAAPRHHHAALHGCWSGCHKAEALPRQIGAVSARAQAAGRGQSAHRHRG
jgi:hypothetical protein